MIKQIILPSDNHVVRATLNSAKRENPPHTASGNSAQSFFWLSLLTRTSSKVCGYIPNIALFVWVCLQMLQCHCNDCDCLWVWRMRETRCWLPTCGLGRRGMMRIWGGIKKTMMVWRSSTSPAVWCGGPTSSSITSTPVRRPKHIPFQTCLSQLRTTDLGKHSCWLALTKPYQNTRWNCRQTQHCTLTSWKMPKIEQLFKTTVLSCSPPPELTMISQGRWTPTWSCVTMERSLGMLLPSPRAPVLWMSPIFRLTVRNVTSHLVPGPTMATRYRNTLACIQPIYKQNIFSKDSLWSHICISLMCPYVTPGGHHNGHGQRWPIRLCGKCGVGMSWDASHQERHNVRLLLRPVSRHHLHSAPAAPLLLLHLQPPPPLLPHLLLGSSGFLPACRLRGEGFPRGDSSPGSHSVPANGGWEHATFRECASYW